MFSDIYLYEGFSVSDRRSQPCTTFGGAEEPHSGIFPKVKPRSFIDVVRADESGTFGANLEFPKGILWHSSVKSTNDVPFQIFDGLKK